MEILITENSRLDACPRRTTVVVVVLVVVAVVTEILLGGKSSSTIINYLYQDTFHEQKPLSGYYGT